MTTTALARSAAIPRATTHRMLTALADQGLIDRAPTTGLWFLGPEIYLLGSVATSRYDAAPVATTTYCATSQRQPGKAPCSLARAWVAPFFFFFFFLKKNLWTNPCACPPSEGSCPLRSHVLYPGKRFPLGIASAGLVMLAHLSDDEGAEYLRRTDLERDWGCTNSRPEIARRIQQTRTDGYSVNPGLVVEGSWGIGAAVFDALDQPQWALSLTGVEARFAKDRTEHLGETLLRAAHSLTQRLKRTP